MSDDFIPLNQSTPVQARWQNRNQQQTDYQNNWQQNNQRRRGPNNNRWSNNSQNSNSFGSDCNSSYGRNDKTNIDAYLHPSMLKDPWVHLRKNS